MQKLRNTTKVAHPRFELRSSVQTQNLSAGISRGIGLYKRCINCSCYSLLNDEKACSGSINIRGIVREWPWPVLTYYDNIFLVTPTKTSKKLYSE